MSIENDVVNHVKSLPPQLCLDLNKFKTYQEYFDACDTDVRTSYRKAFRKYYTVTKLDEIHSLLSAELYEIWMSKDTRQDRKINLNYQHIDGRTIEINKDEWVIPDYSIYKFPNCSLEFFVCYDIHMRVVAYLELAIVGDTAVVHSTLGHGDHLKNGIMKFMFVEVLRTNPYIRVIAYGNQTSFFKDDLLINEMRKL